MPIRKGCEVTYRRLGAIRVPYQLSRREGKYQPNFEEGESAEQCARSICGDRKHEMPCQVDAAWFPSDEAFVAGGDIYGRAHYKQWQSG